jgi:hypothetical protein
MESERERERERERDEEVGDEEVGDEMKKVQTQEGQEAIRTRY